MEGESRRRGAKFAREKAQQVFDIDDQEGQVTWGTAFPRLRQVCVRRASNDVIGGVIVAFVTGIVCRSDICSLLLTSGPEFVTVSGRLCAAVGCGIGT